MHAFCQTAIHFFVSWYCRVETGSCMTRRLDISLCCVLFNAVNQRESSQIKGVCIRLIQSCNVHIFIQGEACSVDAIKGHSQTFIQRKLKKHAHALPPLVFIHFCLFMFAMNGPSLHTHLHALVIQGRPVDCRWPSGPATASETRWLTECSVTLADNVGSV